MTTNKLPTIFLPGLLCDEAVWQARVPGPAGERETAARMALLAWLEAIAACSPSQRRDHR